MNETNQTLAVTTADQPLPVAPISAFDNEESFVSAQRMAKMLCSSSIVPETYRGEQRLGDCVIALEIAKRIGANVLAVMQNLYIVHGRPAWSSQFLISCVNASRRFSPLRYRMTGTKGQDDWGCIAWAVDKSGEKLESPEVTVAIAKAEGWYGKNGSKWKTMPELMLRYRAATLFARTYAPELTMGIQCDDEIIDIAPIVSDPVASAKRIQDAPTFGGKKPKPADEVETAAQVVERVIADEGKVTFDNFADWLKTTSGIDLDAKGISSYAELTEEIAAPLAADPKQMKNCVTIHGGKS